MFGGNAKHVLSIEKETTLGTKLHRQTFHSMTIQKAIKMGGGEKILTMLIVRR